nr:MAG TPA: hypothetical protein [Caudoviricetes sp.]
MFLPVSDSTNAPKFRLALALLSAAFLSFPALKLWGRTFHFWDVPGNKPSPQYIFLIHNQEITIYRNILFIFNS